MKSNGWLFAAALSVAGVALAQTEPKSTVTESTDPAKIAEIEQHAQQLASGTQTTPPTDEHEHMRKRGMHNHKNKNKPMHKPAVKDKAPSDKPAATPSKD